MRTTELEGQETRVVKYLGNEVPVETTASVQETLTAWLTRDGINESVILVDGSEAMRPSDLPATFDGHTIEVKRYEKAG